MAIKGRPPRKSPTFNRPVKDYAPAPMEDKEPLPNFDLLSPEQKTELTAKAKARVEARERDRAMEAFLSAEVDRIERELHPEAFEEEREITVDLAIYADRLIINGKHYMHGRTYTVKKSLFDAMNDIIAHTHKHYAETHRDPTKAFYNGQREISKQGPSYATLNAQTGQVTKF